MVCKSAPSTSSSHSSFWSRRSSRSSSRTSILDTSKSFTEETFEQAEGFSLNNPPTLRHEPLCAQPTTRPTPDINLNNATLTTRPPALESSTVNSGRCLAIIRALGTSLVDAQSFAEVTPAEYNFIATFLSEHCEQQRDRIPVKLLYDPDTCNLVAMPPYSIHEVPFQHLSKQIHQLFASLSLDNSCGVTWNVHFNLSIENETTTIIPDMHLDLRPRRPPGVRAIPFWVGECGFSSLQKEMEHQLGAVADMVPEMDVAMMVCIGEEKVSLPPTSHPLHSLPALSRSAFVPTVAPDADSFEPVVVEGITWVDVRSVIFRVFLRRPDGSFNFKEKGSFYAQGTLYPNHQMDDIDDMLNEATKRLILQFARMMEDMGTDSASVARLRAKSGTTFPVSWLLMFEELQHSIYDTAHSRYYKWLRKPSESAAEKPKRKTEDVPSASDGPSEQQLTLPSPKAPQIEPSAAEKPKGKTEDVPSASVEPSAAEKPKGKTEDVPSASDGPSKQQLTLPSPKAPQIASTDLPKKRQKKKRNLKSRKE